MNLNYFVIFVKNRNGTTQNGMVINMNQYLIERNGFTWFSMLLVLKDGIVLKQTPLYFLQSVASGIYCWMPQPMVFSDALTERTHRITEDLD